MKEKGIDREAAFRIIQERPISKEPEKKEKIKDRLKEVEAAIKELKNPDLLTKIKETLDKDHVDDDKEKLLLFLIAISSFLSPENRISCYISGDSSEGKTNIWKTIKRHLPNGQYKDLTRATTATIEDDIKPYNLIYVGEVNENGNNIGIIETLKQLSEDGIDVIKKDKAKDCKEAKEEVQPRKSVIFSTTQHQKDNELETRNLIISTHGHPKKYAQVNHYINRQASSAKEAIERDKRKHETTWINQALQQLQAKTGSEKIDYILIPYAELFEVNNKSPRTARDLKRFLNLIRSLAWLHQEQRNSFKAYGKKFLIASPEDYVNAQEIAGHIFEQSLSGLEPRLQNIVNKYDSIVRNQPGIIKQFTKRSKDGEERPDPDLDGYNWIDRKLVQDQLNIKTNDTMRKHTKKLVDLGILVYHNCGSRSYIARTNSQSPANLPANYRLITNDTKDLYEVIKHNEAKLIEHGLAGVSPVGSPVSLEGQKIVTFLFSLENYHRRKKSNNVEKSKKKSIIDEIKAKFAGKVSPVENKDEVLSQFEKVKNLKELIVSLRSKTGLPPTQAVLKDNGFQESFIKELARRGDIVELSNDVGGFSYEVR